jgi:spore coat polysaccharide biosynthesis protein SpsF
MTTAAVIVQQRLRNTRHPSKGRLMLDNGRSVTEEVLVRCKQIGNADMVILAVPEGAADDLWEREARITGAELFRGRCQEGDLLRRYRLAADHFGADFILRVTADCPLLNPHQCERVLDRVVSGAYEFAANSGPGSFSLGWSCEAFTIDVLRRADDEATDPTAREHVGPGCRQVAKGICDIVIPRDGAEVRPSLDTQQDYLKILAAFRQMEEAA